MTERQVRIVNPLGMHARPAAQFVKVAAAYTCQIEVIGDGAPVNGKSIMGVMMLAAECGSTLTLRADGADELAALEALAALVADGFGEA